MRPQLAGALALLVVAWAAPLAAQSPARVWVAAGLASGGGGEVSGLGFIGQIAFQKRAHHAVVRGAVFGDCCFTDGDSDTIAELGLLYGRTRSTSFGHLAAAAGASVGSMDFCPDGSSSEACSFVGVPIVAEAALTGRVIGIGLQAFVTVNTKATFGGLALFVPIGWMP